MSSPLLSIITVCKNEPFIEATCKSVVAQTNQGFQWIVIDGASTDNTLEKLEKYKSRIDAFISEEDKGIYHAMNKGISLANGKYLLFLNGGDLLYEPQTLNSVLPYLAADGADVFYGQSYRMFDKPEDCFIKTYPEKLKKEFFLTNTLAHQSSFIRKNLFSLYGNYREDFKIVSDKEKWLCFMDNGVIFQYLPFPCSQFRMNGISRLPSSLLKIEKNKMLSQYFKPQQVQYALGNIFMPDVCGFKR